MLRRFTKAIIPSLLLAISLPLLAVRSLLSPRPSAPQPPQPNPDQFAFHRALPAYEALIDSTVAERA